jgi:hypothetical protein
MGISYNQVKGDTKMKWILSLMMMLAFSVPAAAIVCPAGQHSQCPVTSGHAGAGLACKCVQDVAPTTCVYWHASYPIGFVVVSYTQSQAVVPDDCSNYAVNSTCVSGGQWSPPPTGLVCSNVAPAPSDDGSSGSDNSSGSGVSSGGLSQDDSQITAAIYDPCSDPTLDILTQFLDGCPVSVYDALSYAISAGLLTP